METKTLRQILTAIAPKLKTTPEKLIARMRMARVVGMNKWDKTAKRKFDSDAYFNRNRCHSDVYELTATEAAYLGVNQPAYYVFRTPSKDGPFVVHLVEVKDVLRGAVELIPTIILVNELEKLRVDVSSGTDPLWFLGENYEGW